MDDTTWAVHSTPMDCGRSTRRRDIQTWPAGRQRLLRVTSAVLQRTAARTPAEPPVMRAFPTPKADERQILHQART